MRRPTVLLLWISNKGKTVLLFYYTVLLNAGFWLVNRCILYFCIMTVVKAIARDATLIRGARINYIAFLPSLNGFRLFVALDKWFGTCYRENGGSFHVVAENQTCWSDPLTPVISCLCSILIKIVFQINYFTCKRKKVGQCIVGWLLWRNKLLQDTLSLTYYTYGGSVPSLCGRWPSQSPGRRRRWRGAAQPGGGRTGSLTAEPRTCRRRSSVSVAWTCVTVRGNAKRTSHLSWLWRNSVLSSWVSYTQPGAKMAVEKPCLLTTSRAWRQPHRTHAQTQWPAGGYCN